MKFVESMAVLGRGLSPLGSMHQSFLRSTDMAEKSIHRDDVKNCIEEFEMMLNARLDALAARLDSDKHSATAFYISDLKGYLRGADEMGHRALAFFRERLLK
jgi:hypothetical protein